ncbi:hypothetical protein [Pelagicoccus mobilis]|uniref:Uncharacterized protein n=1 Tax=Pelagicoccus mobilis TaxID=415221 RepID=A0A934VT35_9BACT|nr:hypothetical protein [Pelagicoccus mobilis]MBK1879293.1 hypothetical protein [Pelagicoccus mobilis]
MPQPTADELELAGAQTAINKSASWFYWIAALSVINSLVIAFGGEFSFVVGLGVTLIIDGFAYGAVAEGAPEFVRYIALGMSLAIAGGFALLAIAGRKRILSLYIFGMILYAIDALIFLAFQDWVPVGFHMFALFGLSRVISATKDYRRIENKILKSAEAPAESEEPSPAL